MQELAERAIAHWCWESRIFAGHYDEQALKRVWHYVARFGSTELALSGPAGTRKRSG